MAKTQTAHVVITANAKAAVEVMKMLKEKTDEYIQRLDALKQKKQNGIALTKAEVKEAKELEQKIRALTTAQQKNEAEYRKTRDVMKNIAGSTTKDLKRAYSELAKMLNNTTGQQVKRQEILRRKMREVQEQIDKNTGAVKKQGSAWSTAVKNIMAYIGVFGLFNMAKTKLTDLVSKNKELSDSMANIRKVSQWAASDVEQLTKNLAKIDTRNTLSTLQQLAYEGAKLGIGQYGVEGLTGFVKAAEQVQTALGEDLGEDALPALAKLTEVMGLIPKFGVEQAMQKAGSAIYQLGATSTATGRDIIEFSKRIMGLANVAGVTSSELLGLAGASSTMAIMPEVGATAFNKLFNSIHANTEGIAKAVGLAKEELTDLLYEGRTMDALVKVFEKMQTMSMAELEGRGVFKALGSDGSRLTNVMITMANKVDMLKDSLKTSNEAFSEGKAVINEYMIQNETAAAYFERASNIWEKSFVNPEGVDIVKRLAQEWYNVSYEMTHSASVMAEINLTLNLIAGAAKMLVQLLPTLIQLMFFYGVGKILQGIIVQFRAWYTAATMTGTAMARLNVLMKANAVALFVTGLGLVAAKLIEVTQASKMAAEEEKKRQQVFTDAAAEAMQTYRDQAKALEKYEDALKKSNTSEAERNDIIRQFKSEFGAYLEKLGIEINTYKDMELALKRVNKELKDKAFYETGKALEESYVGDAKSEQTRAMSKYMQVAAEKGLSTDVLLQIKEGKAGTRQQSIVKAFESMDNGQMLGKLYSQLSSGGISYNALSDDVRQFVKQQFGSGESISNVWESLKDVADAAGTLYDTSQEVIKREGQVNKFIEDNAAKYSPNISVEGALGNLKELKKLNEDKLQEGLNTLRDEWKKMNEAETTLKDADAGKITLTPAERSKHTSLLASRNKKDLESGIEKYSAEIRSRRGEGYTPPPTKKELAAADKARLDKLRSDYKQSKENVEGLIAKIDEWYNLQDAVVNNFVASGKITQDEADKALVDLSVARNTALTKARLAVASGSDEDIEDWKKFYEEQMKKTMIDHDKWSSKLYDQMGKVEIKRLHDFLSTFDGSEQMAKLDASSFFDTMRKKAAESQKQIGKALAKAKEKLKETLQKYEYYEQAAEQFAKNLVQIGAVGVTAEQMAKSMEGVPTAKQTMDAAKSMLAAVLQQGTQIYAVDPGDAKAVADMIRKTVETGAAYMDEATGEVTVRQARWFDLFPEIKDWMQNPEQHRKELEDFFNVVLIAEQDYYSKRKQSYSTAKSQQENRARAAGWTEQEERTDKNLQTQGQMQDAGINASFWQQQGLGSIANDPEVLQIQNHIYWRQKDVESAEARLNAIKATHEEELKALMDFQQQELTQLEAANTSEEQMNEVRMQHEQAVTDMRARQSAERMGFEDLLKEHQASLFEQEVAMSSKLAQELQKRVQAVNNLTKPIQDGAKNIGQKWGEMMRGMEEDSMTWKEIWQSMAQAVGDSIIDMMAQYTQNLIMEKMMNAEHKKESISKAQVDVAAGLASAGAKTVGTLGWWGLALIPVIAAVLHGLLAAAFAANNESSSSSSSSSSTKTKIVSGMLTYDEGTGVPDAAVPAASSSGGKQSYLGTDGRVYRATPQQKPLATGLITQPIATTVNGRPALVAERGPEIVIGRRTTRHIMMNEPGLLRHLQQYDRMYSPRPYAARGLRPYDEGNLAESVLGGSAAENGQQSNDRDARLADTLTLLTAAVQQLQQSNASLEARLQKPIQASINKYGTGGLAEEMESGLKFYNKYKR